MQVGLLSSNFPGWNVVKHEGPKANRSPGRDSDREPPKYNWNRYWSARFLAKTVCWRTYIVHAVYELLVCFIQRRNLWSSSIYTCGTIRETDFEGLEFIAARHSKWCSALCLLNVNTSSPLAIFIMYVAELCWVHPFSWTTEYAKIWHWNYYSPMGGIEESELDGSALLSLNTS